MNVIVHVGVPKSGTTTLQESLFSKHPDCWALARPYDNNVLSSAIANELRNADDLDYDVARLKGKVYPALNSNVRANIFSDEVLCSGPMPSVTAKRLKELFPDALVMITIRNQVAAISSYYANHGRLLKNVPGRWNGRHVSFDEWFEHCLRNTHGTFLEHIDYWRLFQVYADVFGNERVGVFAFEEMVADLDSFAGRLGKFSGIDIGGIKKCLHNQKHNSRDRSGTLGIQSFRSRFLFGRNLLMFVPFRSAVRHMINSWVDSTPPYQVSFKEDQKNWIMRTYGASNGALAKETKLDLGALGYPMRNDQKPC